jgi:diguanylate cyclase (GGDEF)-like protein/PAS domain S-box-containing protein
MLFEVLQIKGSNYRTALLLAGLCGALAYACKHFFDYYNGGAIIWFTDAVAIAFFYRSPLKHWPLLLFALLFANVSAALATGIEVRLSFLYAIPSLLEVLAASLLLRRCCPRDHFFDSLLNWFRFAAYAALLPSMIGAGIGGAITAAAGKGSFAEVYVGWYVADAVGILVLLPLALLCRAETLRASLRIRALSRLLVIGLIALGAEVVILSLTPYPLIFVALPLIWAACKLELIQTLVVIFAAMLLLLVQVVASGAPLVVSDVQFIGPALLLHAFAAVVPAYVMAVAVNIERDRNARIVEVESSFRSAMEASRVGMILVSLDGEILKANRSFCQFLGYAEDELIGRSVFDITYPGDLPECELLCDALFSGAEVAPHMEKRYVRKDGGVVWGHVSASLARSVGGQPFYSVAQIEDIDWRKRSEAKLAEAEERWKFSLMGTAQGVYDWDLVSAEVFYSDWLSSCLGIAQAEMTSREDWLARVHSEDRPQLLEQQSLHLHGDREIIDCEYRVRTDNGDYRWITECAKVMERCEHGEGRRLIGIFRDITKTKQLAKSLSEEKERLQVTLTSIADAVIATDTHQCINFMNPVAEQMTGWIFNQARGQHLDRVFMITQGRDGKLLTNPVADCLALGESMFIAEGAVLHSRDGRTFDIKNSASPLKTDNGNLLGAVMVFQDVSESRQLIRQLSYKASHDDLTGLPNRDAFKRELLQASESVCDRDDQHVLAYIDLDRFKVINDSAGHLAGDALLKKIGKCLRGQLRTSDSVARLGGDEFGLLMRHCNREQARLRCEQLIRQIEALRFPWNERVYDVGASVGITEIHRNNNRISDLLSQADVACYSAKRSSRGTVALYEMDQSPAADQHREIIVASEIREALDERRMVIYAQAVAFSSDTSVISHYEILVRMLDDYGNLIMPGTFIPAAERYGLMLQIDRWVAEEILLRRSKQIARTGLGFALNLSAEALGDAGFQSHLLALLERTPIPAQCIGFEITETAMVNQMESASGFVTLLRQRGCKVALDDFGNGLSSFNYLKAFAIDFIKIDGSFVRDVESNFVDLIIVESINQVAHRLGARTIAEYVEEASTAERLRSMGVDLLQGYHVGRPLPLDELLKNVETRESLAPAL